VDKTLCRTCGKRHMVGQCPLAFNPLDHPPIKNVKPSKPKVTPLVEPPEAKKLTELLNDPNPRFGGDPYGPWPLPDKFVKVEPGTLSKPVHKTLQLGKTRKPLRDPVTKKSVVTDPVMVTSDVTHCPTCGQKIPKSNAERQRAYRERKRQA